MKVQNRLMLGSKKELILPEVHKMNAECVHDSSVNMCNRIVDKCLANMRHKYVEFVFKCISTARINIQRILHIIIERIHAF